MSRRRPKPGARRSFKRILGESIHNSSHVYSISYTSTMSQTEYRKLPKKSDRETLLVTIPTAFARAIPPQKSDVVRMTLEGKTVRQEKA